MMTYWHGKIMVGYYAIDRVPASRGRTKDCLLHSEERSRHGTAFDPAKSGQPTWANAQSAFGYHCEQRIEQQHITTSGKMAN